MREIAYLGVAAALFTAACQFEPEIKDSGLTGNQLEKLASGKQNAPAPPQAIHLESIGPSDVAAELEPGAGCDLRQGDRVMLVAVGSDSIVRVNGDIVHLAPSGPVGPSGAFFGTPALGVSIGRTSEAGTTVEETTNWPARVVVTDRTG
ncbi:MAG TPA: hypothetical protein VF637_07585, partial [Sphingomicrobium sp.]